MVHTGASRPRDDGRTHGTDRRRALPGRSARRATGGVGRGAGQRRAVRRPGISAAGRARRAGRFRRRPRRVAAGAANRRSGCRALGSGDLRAAGRRYGAARRCGAAQRVGGSGGRRVRGRRRLDPRELGRAGGSRRVGHGEGRVPRRAAGVDRGHVLPGRHVRGAGCGHPLRAPRPGPFPHRRGGAGIADIRARGHVPGWSTSPDNAGSLAVADRLGFRQIGTGVLYAFRVPIPASE